MMQKLLKVGYSAAVTIPKKSLKELGLKIGDEVCVDVDKGRKEVVEWTDRFINQYRSVLEVLAKK